MLISPGQARYDGEPTLDSVHNYYERLVLQQIHRASDHAQRNPNFMADVACVALNRLPPRYVRHDVDMSFFLSPAEMDEIQDKVAHAVNEALDYVTRRSQQPPNQHVDERA